MAAIAAGEGRAKRYGFTDEELDFIPSTALRAGINSTSSTALAAGLETKTDRHMLEPDREVT